MIKHSTCANTHAMNSRAESLWRGYKGFREPGGHYILTGCHGFGHIVRMRLCVCLVITCVLLPAGKSLSNIYCVFVGLCQCCDLHRLQPGVSSVSPAGGQTPGPVMRCGTVRTASTAAPQPSVKRSHVLKMSLCIIDVGNGGRRGSESSRRGACDACYS